MNWLCRSILLFTVSIAVSSQTQTEQPGAAKNSAIAGTETTVEDMIRLCHYQHGVFFTLQFIGPGKDELNLRPLAILQHPVTVPALKGKILSAAQAVHLITNAVQYLFVAPSESSNVVHLVDRGSDSPAPWGTCSQKELASNSKGAATRD